MPYSKKRLISNIIFLALAVLALGLGGCALQQGNPDAAQQEDLYSKVKQPKGPLELLANLKYVLKHFLLIREDFFTPENMERFFGAELPIRQYGLNRHSRVNVSGSLRGYLDHIDPANKKGSCGPAKHSNFGQFRGGLHRYKDDGFIRLSFNEGCGPTLDDIEQVFGKDWILDRRPLPPVHAPGYWKVRRKTIFYKFKGANSRCEFFVYFEDGLIRGIELSIEAWGDYRRDLLSFESRCSR